MKLRKEVGRLSVSVWHNSWFFVLFLEVGRGPGLMRLSQRIKGGGERMVRPLQIIRGSQHDVLRVSAPGGHSVPCPSGQGIYKM